MNLTDAAASTTSSTAIPSSAQSGPITTPSISQGHPVTPRLKGTSAYRSYMPSFTMPMNGREQPYNIPNVDDGRLIDNCVNI